MPRRDPLSPPAYRLHKASGQAVCYIDRKEVYLGKHNSPESLRKYAELISARTAAATLPASAPVTATIPPGVILNDVLLKFATDRLPKYLTSDGKPSKEQDCFAAVIKILREHFGGIPAASFGPLALRTCRDAMVAKGWSRRYVNKQCIRLRHLIRYGVSFEMVPQTVADSLRSVMPLKPGETTAPERPRRRPVEQPRIDAAKERMRQRNRDIIDLLLFTGARPSELLALLTSDILTKGKVWEADLARHKNAHRDQDRVLYFGPKAQAILQRYLNPAKPQLPLFPTSVDTLTKAIRSACERAGVKPWTAYQLRHSCATFLVDEIGVDAARAILGHKTLGQTLHCSATAKKAAIDAAERLG